MLSGPGIEFPGEVNEAQKIEFLGEAWALWFLVDWPEPFGLAMIEAMACGTPVLAFRHGSVPEIVDDGASGRIVDTMEEATVALPEVVSLDRRAVRRRFEERFSAARRAKDYVGVYRALLRRDRAEHRSDAQLALPRPQTIDLTTKRPYVD
jgi:glycosyltransferase involved in cell wall biosynthesis